MTKPHILLIEPDPILSKTYTKYLTESGYIVRACSDVQGAINHIDKAVPDLVILELQQANHNGYEFLYELRSYVEWQYIPVIINTVVPKHAVGVDQIAMDELGVRAYLYKPVTSLSTLSYTVDHSLKVISK